MQFVGTSLLGTGSALRRVDPGNPLLPWPDVEESVCSMRSTLSSLATTTGAGDPDSLAARVAHLEVLTSEIAGPPFAEQIDALRQALTDERRERQMSHDALLKTVEALGLEDVATCVLTTVMQKVKDEIGMTSAEQSANLEILKARVQDVELHSRNQFGELEVVPRALRDLQTRLDSVQAYVDASQSKTLAVIEQRLEANRMSQLKEHAATEQALERGVAASAECSRTLIQWRSLVDTGTLCTLPQLEAKLKEKLAEVQTEWRNSLNDERVSCGERCRAMGKAIGEEFERNTVVKAVAEARTEACTVACNVLTKELDAWQKEREIGCSRAELMQLTERLAIAEQHLKEVALPIATAKEAKDASSVSLDSADAASIRALSEASMRLESRLSATSAEVERTQTSMQLELANVRADIRRLSSVDMHGMQSNVQKLLLQSDTSRRELEHVEKQGNEAWHKEAQARVQGDQKIERVCLEQLQEREAKLSNLQEDARIQGTLLQDVTRHLGRLQEKESCDSPSGKSELVSAKLQGRLQSLITKLDDRCIEGLGPDLSELNSLLATSEQNVDMLSVSAAPSVDAPRSEQSKERSLPRRHVNAPSSPRFGGAHPCRALSVEGARAQSPPVYSMRLDYEPPEEVRLDLPAHDRRPSLGPPCSSTGAPSSDHDEASGSAAGVNATGSAQNLKEEILHYLRSEFSDHISDTIRSMQAQTASNQLYVPENQGPPPACSPVAGMGNSSLAATLAALGANGPSSLRAPPGSSNGGPASLRAPPASNGGPSNSLRAPIGTPRGSSIQAPSQAPVDQQAPSRSPLFSTRGVLGASVPVESRMLTPGSQSRRLEARTTSREAPRGATYPTSLGQSLPGRSLASSTGGQAPRTSTGGQEFNGVPRNRAVSPRMASVCPSDAQVPPTPSNTKPWNPGGGPVGGPGVSMQNVIRQRSSVP